MTNDNRIRFFLKWREGVQLHAANNKWLNLSIAFAITWVSASVGCSLVLWSISTLIH